MREEATKEQWGRLYELAAEFKKREPWAGIYNDEILAVSFSEEETAYFTIMGNGGMIQGFSMYIGLERLNGLLGLMCDDERYVPSEYVMAEQDSISMFIAGKDDVPKKQLEVIRELGLRFRGERSWIYFERREKGFMPYSLNQEEVLLCTKYLEKFLEALKCYQRESRREFYMDGRLYVYRSRGGQWTGTFEEAPLKRFEIDRARFTDSEMIEEIRKMKRTKENWEVDCYPVFCGLSDEAYEKPVMERHLLVVGQKTELGLAYDMLLPEEWGETVSRRIGDAILKIGRPKKIVVPNDLVYNMIDDLCHQCGIELEVGDTQGCDSFRDEWDMFEEEGAEEEILGSLGELGFDIDKLKNDAYNMSEDEFVKNMMTDLTRIFEQEMGGIFDDSDEVEHELKNRKQKADEVRNFFGQGTVPEEYYDEVEKFIEADLADSWEDLLGESTKPQLSDMAGRLKAQVKKGAPKGELIEAIMNRVHEESSVLMGLLTEEEQDVLEMMMTAARDMEGWWDLEDFPLTMEQVLKLLNYAFIDIGWYTSDEDMTLVLRVVEEF